MTKRAPLHYLVSAKDGFDGTDLSHALVGLSPERVEMIIARIQECAERRKKDDPFLKMVFWDWDGIEFRNTPDDFWEMEDEEHERHHDFLAIEAVQNAQFGRFVIADFFAASEAPRTETEQMTVYESAVSWQANYKHGDAKLWTNELPIGDLLIARLYYAEPRDIDVRFAELARVAPDCAVEVIEKGIEVVGLEAAQDIRSHLSAESLAILLENENAAIRQRAILALGGVREERSRSRSR